MAYTQYIVSKKKPSQFSCFSWVRVIYFKYNRDALLGKKAHTDIETARLFKAGLS